MPRGLLLKPTRSRKRIAHEALVVCPARDLRRELYGQGEAFSGSIEARAAKRSSGRGGNGAREGPDFRGSHPCRDRGVDLRDVLHTAEGQVVTSPSALHTSITSHDPCLRIPHAFGLLSRMSLVRIQAGGLLLFSHRRVFSRFVAANGQVFPLRPFRPSIGRFRSFRVLALRRGLFVSPSSYPSAAQLSEVPTHVLRCAATRGSRCPFDRLLPERAYV